MESSRFSGFLVKGQAVWFLFLVLLISSEIKKKSESSEGI